MSSTDGVFGHQVVTSLRAADDDLAKAVLAPLWQAGDGDVESAVELLDRIEAKAVAMRSTLLVQAEERSLREPTGAPSTGRWLVERFRWSRSRAPPRSARRRPWPDGRWSRRRWPRAR